MAPTAVAAPPTTTPTPLSYGGIQAIIVSAIFPSIATVLVVIRYYVRVLKKIGFLTEDWMILVGLVSTSPCAFGVHSRVATDC